MDACPGCLAGEVYKRTPAVLPHIVGHTPLSSERHGRDQLRCNGCVEVFSAKLPEYVKVEGRPKHNSTVSLRQHSVKAYSDYI